MGEAETAALREALQRAGQRQGELIAERDLLLDAARDALAAFNNDNKRPTAAVFEMVSVLQIALEKRDDLLAASEAVREPAVHRADHVRLRIEECPACAEAFAPVVRACPHGAPALREHEGRDAEVAGRPSSTELAEWAAAAKPHNVVAAVMALWNEIDALRLASTDKPDPASHPFQPSGVPGDDECFQCREHKIAH